MKIIVGLQCPFCGAVHTVEVEKKDWYDYINGALVQNAFPYLNSTEREQIISEMCPDCQEKLFGD